MPRDHHIIQLMDTHTPALAEVLSSALSADPVFRYLLPQVPRRRAAVPWFFGFLLRLARPWGMVHTTPDADGGAIWLLPQHAITGRELVRAGGWALPLCFGWHGLRRALQVDGAVTAVRQRSVPTPHWYLMVLGVAPAKQGQGLGRALLHPILTRAASDGLPCYLETFWADVISFYETQGFRVVAEKRVGGGPRFWAMVRDAPGRCG